MGPNGGHRGLKKKKKWLDETNIAVYVTLLVGYLRESTGAWWALPSCVLAG